MLDRVQSTCSVQHLSFCKIPWQPFPGLRPEVLIRSIHGLAILSCSECSAQVRWPPSASRRGSCDPERSPDGGLMIVAAQEVYPQSFIGALRACCSSLSNCCRSRRSR